ncbi:MAG: protein kinase [Actinomycetota bacterium]
MQEPIDLGIDHLTDVEEIGRGGFSVVYAATNTLLGTRVAVKVLGRLSDEADRRRFERECQVMGRLSRHPNVVTVHHAGYAHGTDPYLLMELVDGGSLADRLRLHGPVPWPEAIDLVTPIAEALAYVHDAGILHRDVKPENILIGADGQPLLTDFGIARLGDGATNTGTGIAASWLHAPPETFDNEREPRSDLYSLASTLHQIIAGTPPFWRSGEDSLNPLMRRLLHEPAPRLDPSIAPPALADLVVGALAKAPSERPSDLRTFAADLLAVRATAMSGIAYQPPRTAAPADFVPNARAAAADAPEWFGPDSLTVSADQPPRYQPATPPPAAVSDGAVDALARPEHQDRPTAAGGRPLALWLLAGLVGLSLVAGVGALVSTRLGGEPSEEADGPDPGPGPGGTASTTSTVTATPSTTSAGVAPVGGATGGRLAEVQQRGELNCGVNDSNPGFGVLDSDGTYRGFDIDFCRVVAAAVLGDADAVNYVPLSAAERFTSLQLGEIDVLSRNTSQTATRTGEFGADFPFTTFFDGQGIMARADSGIASVADLDGAAVCVLSSTTTELNIGSALADRGVDAELLAFEDNNVAREAYEAGQCDAWTSDVTVLSRFRSLLATPDDHLISSELLSAEPLGLAVLAGDTEWSTAVRWAAMLTVQAWEAGISSDNIDSYQGSDPTALVITGQAPFDPGFGLQENYPALVVRQVGNYREIYERNLADSGLVLEGSANDLVANGGQMFAAPLR